MFNNFTRTTFYCQTSLIINVLAYKIMSWPFLAFVSFHWDFFLLVFLFISVFFLYTPRRAASSSQAQAQSRGPWPLAAGSWPFGWFEHRFAWWLQAISGKLQHGARVNATFHLLFLLAGTPRLCKYPTSPAVIHWPLSHRTTAEWPSV